MGVRESDAVCGFVLDSHRCHLFVPIINIAKNVCVTMLNVGMLGHGLEPLGPEFQLHEQLTLLSGGSFWNSSDK